MDGQLAPAVRPRPVAAPPQVNAARDVLAGRPRACRELAGRAYGVDGLDAVRPQRPCARRVDEPADIVLAHDLNTLPVAALAARRLGARLLYDSHEVFAELPVHSRLARRRWLVVERALLPRVEAMWMSSPGHAEVFAANHGVPVPPVIINVPSLDPDPRAAGDPRPARRAGSRSGAGGSLLYIGGVYPHRPLRMAWSTQLRELEDCARGDHGSRAPELRGRIAWPGPMSLASPSRVRVASAVPIADVVRYAAAGRRR